MPVAVSTQPKEIKKVDYFTEELLSRPPPDPRLLAMLGRKCGPPIQEMRRERNEGKRPPGRIDENAPSRHERVPPATVVLMFNCFESGFELEFGDISTVPEAEAVEIRSITSGKVSVTVRDDR